MQLNCPHLTRILVDLGNYLCYVQWKPIQTDTIRRYATKLPSPTRIFRSPRLSMSWTSRNVAHSTNTFLILKQSSIYSALKTDHINTSNIYIICSYRVLRGSTTDSMTLSIFPHACTCRAAFGTSMSINTVELAYFPLSSDSNSTTGNTSLIVRVSSNALI